MKSSRTAAPLELKNVSVLIRGETADGNIVEFEAHRLDPVDTNIEVVEIERFPEIYDPLEPRFLHHHVNKTWRLTVDAKMIAVEGDETGVNPIYTFRRPETEVKL